MINKPALDFKVRTVIDFVLKEELYRTNSNPPTFLKMQVYKQIHTKYCIQFERPKEHYEIISYSIHNKGKRNLHKLLLNVKYI